MFSRCSRQRVRISVAAIKSLSMSAEREARCLASEEFFRFSGSTPDLRFRERSAELLACCLPSDTVAS